VSDLAPSAAPRGTASGAGTGADSVPGATPEEVATVRPGIDLCYQTFGDPSGRPLLLVMGLGAPMTWWPLGLCRQLVEAGFYVVRFDNRDVGRSTKLRQHRVTQRDLVRAFLGRRVTRPYSLRDMAEDAVALLDHLGLPAAHVAGISMGGMIAQTMTLERPDRVLSLTSIMSTTGARRTGYQDPLLLPHLLRRQSRDREAYVDGAVTFGRLIGSPAYRGSEEAARERARETYDRGICLSGTRRQMLAVVTQRDRTRALQEVKVPVTVVHGLSDRMVHVSGGRATAAAVPEADLVLVDGMGHDLPEGLFPTFVAAIRGSAERSEARTSS
jgi:pimeloyl-ACP methyl ester carboxylesterase